MRTGPGGIIPHQMRHCDQFGVGRRIADAVSTAGRKCRGPIAEQPQPACREQLRGQRVGHCLSNGHARANPFHEFAQSGVAVAPAQLQRPGDAPSSTTSR
jgi:hypothetical protein